jgi:hypothetical protein
MGWGELALSKCIKTGLCHDMVAGFCNFTFIPSYILCKFAILCLSALVQISWKLELPDRSLKLRRAFWIAV